MSHSQRPQPSRSHSVSHRPSSNAAIWGNPGAVNGQATVSTKPSWQQAMQSAIRSQAELRQRLNLPPAVDAHAAEDFPTLVPLELLERIRADDPSDPILRQVLATEQELEPAEGFVSDPVGDLQALSAGGLLRKYQGRALLITNGTCAVHCRYCFRREFPYTETAGVRDRYASAIEQIAADPSIDEVLLSGGDPLTLSDSLLAQLIHCIESIQHVKRIRIHTRLPIVIPQRVTDQLVEMLATSRLACWFVVHCNCVQELDQAVFAALRQLTENGIPVLNQAVLLAGVNDSTEALTELCLALVNANVQPYYLHQLDQVRGASHFLVPQSHGEAIIEELRRKLPGYAVPKFVKEVPGAPSKTPIA